VRVPTVVAVTVIELAATAAAFSVPMAWSMLSEAAWLTTQLNVFCCPELMPDD